MEDFRFPNNQSLGGLEANEEIRMAIDNLNRGI